MLWKKLKERMMIHPQTKICDGESAVTYEEAVIFAEHFGERLDAPCYGVYCASELSAALAVLACFAAEKTAMPLSPRYGELHARRILEFVSPRYVIDDAAGELRIVEIEGQRYMPPEESPAVMMCTSGTTGEPKGVMLGERNLLTNVEDIARYFALDAHDKILITRPLYHSAVLTGEFLAALFAGAEIHFFDQPYHIQEFVRILEEKKITVTCGTPAFFGITGQVLRRSLPLRKVAVSGECLTRAAATRIRALFPSAEIFHVYGLTEASPRVAYLSPAHFDDSPGMLDTPLASVTLKIADGHDAEVPDGTEGELLVRGDSVMLGYYKNPQLSETVLRGGWLHTGDMAVREADGKLKILGRKDGMIIYAGMNIYPQEIENALMQDARVEEVLAYGVPHPYAGQAVAVKVKGRFAGRDEVVVLCRQVLPAYAQPTRVELVDALPRNASGKLLRKNLSGGNDEKGKEREGL